MLTIVDLLNVAKKYKNFNRFFLEQLMNDNLTPSECNNDFLCSKFLNKIYSFDQPTTKKGVKTRMFR
jgi:hypothetical protein